MSSCQRRCVVCGKSTDKERLLRFVHSSDGENFFSPFSQLKIKADFKAVEKGRGVYSHLECLNNYKAGIMIALGLLNGRLSKDKRGGNHLINKKQIFKSANVIKTQFDAFMKKSYQAELKKYPSLQEGYVKIDVLKKIQLLSR